MAGRVKYRKSVIPYLPEEIIEQILLRLSHESVIRSKLVCKSWYNIIKTDDFVQNHLRCHTSSHTTRALIVDNARKIEKNFLNSIIIPISWDNDKSGDTEQIQVHNFQTFNELRCPNILLKGLHCNGIVCFTSHVENEKSKVAFYNPTLGQCKMLDSPYEPEFWVIANGFGYNQKTNVYKYVRIFQSKDISTRICRALVCTLSSNSCSNWREIEVNSKLYKDTVMPPYDTVMVPILEHGGVYLKSFYYWFYRTERIKGIASFDMSNEKFETIPLPLEMTEDQKYRPRTLSVWKEEFLTLFMKTDTIGSFEMWVMGANDTLSGMWRKHLTIDLSGGFLYPLEFWSHEDLLIRPLDQPIMSYNIRTKKTRKLDVPPNLLDSLTLYTKSLVSLGS